MLWMLMGCDVEPGKAGVDDLVVDPGVPVGAYRWHDATGEQVTEGAELTVWVDGLLWRVDPESGKLGGARTYGEQLFERDSLAAYPFEAYGLFWPVRCEEGPAYVKAPPPRLVVDGYLWGEDGVLYVRPDDVIAVSDADGSAYRTSATGCGSALLPLAPLVRHDELTALGIPPTSGWVAPLHLEPVE